MAYYCYIFSEWSQRNRLEFPKLNISDERSMVKCQYRQTAGWQATYSLLLLALWLLGNIWIQHHQSREQNLLITDCDNIRQSNISASALFLYGCWGWCVRLHLPLAHQSESTGWYLRRTSGKCFWLPSPLTAKKQVTKSHLNNCIDFLFDLESLNLLTELIIPATVEIYRTNKRNSDLIVTAADSTGTLSHSWRSSLGFPVAIATPKKLLNLGRYWQTTKSFHDFCCSADLKVERKISSLRSFHWSDKSCCHIKLTWTLEPHRKSIKVCETGSFGKNSMQVGKASQVEDVLSMDNYSLLRLSQGTVKTLQFSNNSGRYTVVLILMPPR